MFARIGIMRALNRNVVRSLIPRARTRMGATSARFWRTFTTQRLRLANVTSRQESGCIQAVALMAQRPGKRPRRQHLPGESVD